MSTTILASIDDVADRLGRTIDDKDEGFVVDGLIAEASVDVLEFCCRDSFDEPVPDTVRIVVSRMVARSLQSPTEFGGSASVEDRGGPFERVRTPTADASSGGVWLTRADKRRLRRYSLAGGTFSVDMTP